MPESCLKTAAVCKLWLLDFGGAEDVPSNVQPSSLADWALEETVPELAGAEQAAH